MKATNEGLILPKICLATPVSARHSHLLDEWLDHLDKLTYPNIEVMLVDTTPDTEDYFELLKTKIVKGKPIKVFRHEWDYQKYHAVQWMAFAREVIRQEFIKDTSYSHLFWLDDDIFLPKWGVQRLLSYNKEQAGFYVHVYFDPHTVPCILKSGDVVMGQGLQYYSFDEIDAYRSFIEKLQQGNLSEDEQKLIPFIVKDQFYPQLFQPYAVNLGCLLVKRNVVEAIPFRTHDTFVMGEDLWYFNEANDKKFIFWCDSSYRCEHKNTEWDSIVQKGPKGLKPGFWIAFGPNDADKVDFIDRRPDGDN